MMTRHRPCLELGGLIWLRHYVQLNLGRSAQFRSAMMFRRSTLEHIVWCSYEMRMFTGLRMP